jgi:UDP-N-acetylmuramoyl-tripeptide--D-alanyl-D-alanine ligase
MEIKELYAVFLKHPEISIDSRTTAPGSLFFALKGDTFDGNIFAEKALANGAAYAVIDNRDYRRNDRYIVVDNVLAALQQLARHHRDQFTMPVIGITGSNGKTTTKELVGAVLSRKLRTIWTKGNLNNHIGVPLTLLTINRYTEIAVIEMGANHQGEIARLCEVANPDYGLITNIGKAHLEGFGGFEGVIKAKTELYDHLRKNDGKIFINIDDGLLLKHAERIRTITYGTDPKANVHGEIADAHPFLSVKVNIGHDQVEIRSRLIGSYNLSNILVASCIGHYFNVEPNLISAAIENYKPENNRSQLIRTEHNNIIMDAYNANPTSMELAIRNFVNFPEAHKVLILGDMLELGAESEAEHRRILDMAQSVNAELIILVGKMFQNLHKDDSVVSFQTSAAALKALGKKPLIGKTILIKGSRGIQLEKLLKVL